MLQAVLSEFQGTILLISHDRYLIDALATQIWSVQPGSMTVFKGSYQEYIAVRDGKVLAATPTAAAKALARPTAAQKPTKPAQPMMSAREREKRTAAIEEQIHNLEIKLVQLSGDLGAASQAGQVNRVRELGEAYAAAQAELDTKMNEWEALLA